MIAVDALTVRVGDATLVHAGGFTVSGGEWVSVLGPNGAGKTTLLRALAGLVEFSGSVLVAGSDARRLSRRALGRLVALVPQQPVVPAGLTVQEYVLLGRTPHLSYLGQESADDIAGAAAALDRLDLGAFGGRPIESLSGGELQRALVARAFAQEAPILLLDEPTASLDVGHQQAVLELVDRLRRESGLTVLATMHDLTLAAQYGDRTILLERGRIVADGAPADVLTEQTLADLYGTDVRLVRDGEALAGVVPLRRRAG